MNFWGGIRQAGGLRLRAACVLLLLAETVQSLQPFNHSRLLHDDGELLLSTSQAEKCSKAEIWIARA
jgi:hypothetical protein